MKPYLVSLAIGLAVGGLYSLLSVRSPAPPAVALIGLLGMLIGEQATSAATKWVKRDGTVASDSHVPRDGDAG